VVGFVKRNKDLPLGSFSLSHAKIEERRHKREVKNKRREMIGSGFV
jgi:hypothetical protein